MLSNLFVSAMFANKAKTARVESRIWTATLLKAGIVIVQGPVSVRLEVPCCLGPVPLLEPLRPIKQLTFGRSLLKYMLRYSTKLSCLWFFGSV